MMVKKSNKLKKVLLILSVMIIFIFLAMAITTVYFYNKYKLDINKLTSLNNGIKVYSASGIDNTLYNTNRSIVEIETLPEYVKNAFIDIEDKRFYSHNGYDLKRILKSGFINLTTNSKSQGASTISQQLIKNALLSNEKTYSRKLKEIILSIKMEKRFSKDEILEMYLNTIYFGSNAYGIENASKIYFNKSSKDLTLNEACCLAGLIKSPAYYSPKTNKDNSNIRKNLVAKRMLEVGDIDMDSYELVVNTPISIIDYSETDNSYEKEAIFEACKLLNLNERDLINKNYQIITFKDDNLQSKVIEYNNKTISLSEEISNSSLDSLSVVTNTDGHVLAYYANSNYNLHNLCRQPASTLKPLAVYLPCFEHNILSPASKILDEEINYNGFSPQNADKVFHGHVSCRDSLRNSYNVPAVKALDYLGLKKSKETLSKLGINITNSDLNLSLALGAVKNGVNLLDLLSAYGVLANQGEYNHLCFVNKILDEKGEPIYEHEKFATKVIGDDSCFLINDILRDCAKVGTAKRLASLNLPVASKTGTASTPTGNTDLYNITYTTNHLMLTWIADIDNKVLPNSMLSSSQPTEINKDICTYLYSNNKPNDFELPANIKKVEYDLIEYEINNILVQPNHNIERYIAYDYFKNDNQPSAPTLEDFDFSIAVDKIGCSINFESKKYETYNIYKSTRHGKKLIETIKEKNGNVTVLDKEVFQFDEIEYYITNSQGNIIGKIKKIKPQDFLVNLLNNEIITSKKKWLV